MLKILCCTILRAFRHILSKGHDIVEFPRPLFSSLRNRQLADFKLVEEKGRGNLSIQDAIVALGWTRFIGTFMSGR